MNASSFRPGSGGPLTGLLEAYHPNLCRKVTRCRGREDDIETREKTKAAGGIEGDVALAPFNTPRARSFSRPAPPKKQLQENLAEPISSREQKRMTMSAPL